MKVQRQIDTLLAQRAAEWMEILERGATPQEREDFVRWLRTSRSHVEQFLEMQELDAQLSALGRKRLPDAAQLLAKWPTGAVPLPASTNMTGAHRPRRAAWRPAAAAAAVVGALALGTLVWPGNSSGLYEKLFAADIYSTAVGEQRSLTLSDGSVVTLNAVSSVRVTFTNDERRVKLTRGEAIFKVAPNATRPFLVETPTTLVRALGTQFNVYQRPDDTVVSVLEGRVEVRAIATSASPALGKGALPGAAHGVAREDLRAGEEARVLQGRVKKSAQADVEKTVAWRQRRLIFDHTPLEDIVREFNRFGRAVQFRLEDIPPGSLRYGGSFDADDPESLASILRLESDLTLERRAGEIVIRPYR